MEEEVDVETEELLELLVLVDTEDEVDVVVDSSATNTRSKDRG